MSYLRVGDLIEVCSLQEIMRSLDADGSLDCLPFMPEMVAFCGRQFRVFKCVDKIIDLIGKGGYRRMSKTVLLEDVRCDGHAHAGCQAGCQLLWKERWLRRLSTNRVIAAENGVSEAGAQDCESEAIDGIKAHLMIFTRRPSKSPQQEDVYRCQTTELFRASSDLARWDIRQYLSPLWSGNITLTEFLSTISISIFNLVQRLHGGCQYPHWVGSRSKNTPTLRLNLQPGELVMVKSKEEIQKTLDTGNRNRGLWFDFEMLRYCGGQFRVLRNVDRLIEERTGRLVRLQNPCVILENVTGRGDFHRFYPQNDYILWRDIWVHRVEDTTAPASDLSNKNPA